MTTVTLNFGAASIVGGCYGATKPTPSTFGNLEMLIYWNVPINILRGQGRRLPWVDRKSSHWYPTSVLVGDYCRKGIGGCCCFGLVWETFSPSRNTKQKKWTVLGSSSSMFLFR